MRDRLMEIVSNALDRTCGISSCAANIETNDSGCLGCFIDELLANGVIAPLVKVGDTVWVLETLPDEFDKCKNCKYFYEGGMGDHPACQKTRYGYRAAECIEIIEVIVTEKQLYWWLYMNDFGKTVFSTREGAEAAKQALRKEDEGNGTV